MGQVNAAAIFREEVANIVAQRTGTIVDHVLSSWAMSQEDNYLKKYLLLKILLHKIRSYKRYIEYLSEESNIPIHECLTSLRELDRMQSNIKKMVKEMKWKKENFPVYWTSVAQKYWNFLYSFDFNTILRLLDKDLGTYNIIFVTEHTLDLFRERQRNAYFS